MLLAAFLSALSPACPQQSEKRQRSASICSIQRLHEICEPAVRQAHVIHLFFKAVMIHSFLWMTNYRAHLKNPLLRENILSLSLPLLTIFIMYGGKRKKWPWLNRCKEKIILKITLLSPQISYTLHSQFQIGKSYPYTCIYIYLYGCICRIQWVRWNLLIPSQEIC